MRERIIRAILRLGFVGYWKYIIKDLETLSKTSASILKTQQVFRQLASEFGDPNTVFVQLRDATTGTINDAELMRYANQYMLLGLAKTLDELQLMFRIASKNGNQMGMSTEESLSKFAITITNCSIPRLDAFGISGAKIRKSTQRLMEAEGIERPEAFRRAVMEVLEVGRSGL